MENRKGTRARLPERSKPTLLFLDFLASSFRPGAKALRISNCRTGVLASFHFLLSIFCLIGCGAPGEPVPPSPPVPLAVADLTARQNGDGVEVSFTLPTKSITGTKLPTTPAVEILRGSVKADGSADQKSFRVVYTIPGAMLEGYRSEGRVVFTDPIAAEETKAHPGGAVAYAVRTRESQKKASADSNVVYVRVFPVPAVIPTVEAKVTETAVELSWPIPTTTASGEPVGKIAEYRIYRSESHPALAESDSPSAPPHKESQEGKPGAHLTLLTSTDTNSYRDTSTVFDNTYVYVVRSVVQAEGKDLESPESAPVTVTPKDIFPPAAPQGVVAAVLPSATAGSLVVDISWSINLETDLAGYHVYRSEQEGTRGRLLRPDLLPTPAVRDTSVEPGHRYWYTVTAVDRAGNESAASTPIAVDVTQPNP